MMIDIEQRLTLDERSAVDFVLHLRKRWAGTVYPALVEEFGDPAGDMAGTTQRLHELRLYPWFSHLERTQQKMLWRTAGDAVLARGEELTGELSAVPGSARGTLELSPGFELPDWYTAYDIHIQPGSYFSDDLSAYVYELGARIVMLRDNDGYKFHRLFVTTALPDRPGATRVLDMGCGFGKSTRPLAGRYPAAEVIGVDLSAPGLRLAHAEAEAEGLAIHYRQRNATDTGIESGTCDVVTGTMVLHEMPAAVIEATIAEAARLLKPGGAIGFLEFAMTGDPLRDATVMEHAERNNEPYFHDLFGTDVVRACRDNGLVGAAWLPFDERNAGVAAQGWGDRPEWHFPWAVLTATKPAGDDEPGDQR
ncbi:class I SAM-dependent methyltransferase [Dactylosporangium sp. CA-092794]|uniref:class I SAM-dependent methyltransferase n=1 Tax=Dactylosporangium sp. CA-092794 TaxID=3239929 RepID=UPI003D8F8815